TDHLLALARSCDLRWPVIVDRWRARFGSGTAGALRSVEDLQHRYYEVGTVLARKRAAAALEREAARLSGAEVGGTGGDATRGGGNAAADAPGGDGSNPRRPQTQQNRPISPAEAAALRASRDLSALHPSLAPSLARPAAGTAHVRGSKTFDLAAERARRNQADRIWRRSKEEEREEGELRAELRAVEAQLRRLKRGGRHLVPAGSAAAAGGAGGRPSGPTAGEGGAARPGGEANKRAAASASGAAAPSRRPPPSTSGARATAPPPRPPPDPFHYARADVAASFADTAPVPAPGTPYLQSGRLFPPSIEGRSGLNKHTLKQMGTVLDELGVPKEPIPTRRSCDLYDGVRKDALMLLIVQKAVLRKEAELAAKKGRLMALRAAAADEAKAGEEQGAKGSDGKAGEAKAGAGAKGKKASEKAEGKAKGSGKGKRPRADSGTSAAAVAEGKAGGDEAGKKGAAAGGDGPKKKPRKKAAAAAAAPAVAIPAPGAAMPPPPVSADAGGSSSALDPLASGSAVGGVPGAAPPVDVPSNRPPHLPAAPAAGAPAAAAPSKPAMHPGKTTGKTVGKAAPKRPGRKPKVKKKAS
ncbi:hypothetical protein ACHAWF_007296, partial [Thalassiosira exigua]